jgi:hypothetical protein
MFEKTCRRRVRRSFNDDAFWTFDPIAQGIPIDSCSAPHGSCSVFSHQMNCFGWICKPAWMISVLMDLDDFGAQTLKQRAI